MDFSADLILICNSLDAGGIERVVSTLANTWSRQGRKICVVTLHDRRRFYALDPAVHHVIVDRVRLTTHDAALRRRLGEAARERVSEYDLASALAKWEAVIGLSQ